MLKKIYLPILFLFPYLLFSNGNWTGKDKVMHFSASTFGTIWNYNFANKHWKMSNDKSIFIAINFTGFAGLAKEYNDSKKKDNYWSWEDIAYNTAGIIAGIMIIKGME